jgi:hypothetical protein
MTEIQDIPLQAYVRSRQLDLAASLEGKKAVCLDIKFWISLLCQKQVFSGGAVCADAEKIFDLGKIETSDLD